MIRVLTVFGTRPEAIKMAPLIKELKSRSEFDCQVCITAQHRQMLDQVLTVFNIEPDYDLNIMRENQTLSDITTAALCGIERVLRDAQPHIVLVHGDTTSSFAGALAAYYMKIPVGHVEAGLRTYNKYSPFPEEMNRQMVDGLSDMLFAPTKKSRQNLLDENKDGANIYVTGNTAIDALKTTVTPSYSHPVLEWCQGARLILLTAHRRENLGTPMLNIFRAVRRVAHEFHDVKVVYPVHMNPRVQELAEETLSGVGRIRLIEPLDVIDFHNFLALAHIILTDSGGIQEEAPSLGKPVLVLRDTTERPEGIDAGTLRLVGTGQDEIYRATSELLVNREMYNEMSRAVNPYGDGFASKRIADAILERLIPKV